MTPPDLEEIERRAEALGPALQEVRSLAEEEDFQGGMSRPKGHPTSVQRVQPLLDLAADIPALLAYVRELEGTKKQLGDLLEALDEVNDQDNAQYQIAEIRKRLGIGEEP